MTLALVSTRVLYEEASLYGMGPASLAASLAEARPAVVVRLVELPVAAGGGPLPESSLEQILAHDPKVVGFSCSCWDTEHFLELIVELKQERPELTVVLGGSGVTGREEALALSPGVDVVVRGEGEETLCELVEKGFTDLSAIRGVVFNDGGVARWTAPRPPLNASRLPSPYLSGHLEPPGRDFLVEVYRGCALGCRHCNRCQGVGGGLRLRDLETLKAEWRWAAERGHETVSIIDQPINVDPSLLSPLSREMSEAAALGLRFSYELHLESLTGEQTPLLEAIPTSEVSLRLDTTDQRARALAGLPRFEPKSAAERIKAIPKGHPLSIELLLGAPGDSLAGFRRTLVALEELIELCEEKTFKSLYVFWATASPGSHFADRASELGLVVARRGVPYVLGSETFPASDLLRAKALLAYQPRLPELRFLDPQIDEALKRVARSRRGRRGRRAALVGLALDSFSADSYCLSLGYLKAAALQRAPKAEVFLKDYTTSLDRSELPEGAVEEVLAEDPEVVGLSCYCWGLEAYEALIPQIRALSPETKIVLGGPSVSSAPLEALRRYPGADAVVIGEGEVIFSTLLAEGFGAIEGAPGVISRGGAGQPVGERGRPLIVDLDAVPSPYLTGAQTPPGWNFLLELFRGCSLKCPYCAWQRPGAPRRRDLETIARELEWALENNYQGCYLFSSSINLDEALLAQFAEVLRQADPDQGIKFNYHLFIHGDSFRESQLELLATIKSLEPEAALESANPDALKAVGRPPLDRGVFAERVRLLGALHPLSVTIILGIPGDTLEGFKDTIEYLTSIANAGGQQSIAVVYVCWMNITRGSVLDRRKARYGLELSPRGFPYVLSSATFPREDIVEAIRYLYEHPERELFRWVEASPWLYLDGLDFIDRGEWARVFKRPRPDLIGPTSNDEADAELRSSDAPVVSTVPGLEAFARPGRPILRGWSLTSVRPQASGPVLVFSRGEERFSLQIQRHDARRPKLLGAGDFDLVWLIEGAPFDKSHSLTNEQWAITRWVSAKLGARG